jgi:UDP-N-acetylglucosamine--N-acetylmuramyl-(pentapeptide) pyrophosphoryl-undecaprenol N-acetylglucosamine transferase
VLITDDRYKNYSGSLKQFDAHTIRTGTFAGGIFKRIKSVCNIFIGFYQSWQLLRQLKPEVVVGFGGYPSFPTMFVALKMGIKTVIHEQNSLLGHTNQVLSSKVDAMVTSFPEVIGLKKENQNKVKLLGNPVRPSITSLREMPYPDLHENGTLKILVLGGSQGASVFSRIVPEAMAMLPAALRSKIRIDQQCRADDLEETRAAYAKIGVSADLASFFMDVPLRLASTHLVITRSGASTLSEVTVAGRPAIMVPYPHAKDNHQMINATALEDAGGGWVMPQDAFTATALSTRIESFLNLPSTLTEAAEKAKEAGRPNACKDLADMVQNMLEE